MRPLAFVFEDPNWISKILLGGVFVLASVVLVGIFFVLGYCARLVRNVINGVQLPLPEWDDLGEFFAEGLRLFFVAFAYMAPLAIIGVTFGVGAAFMNALSSNHSAEELTGALASMTIMCIMFPLGLVLSVWLPGALLMTSVSGRFSAGFEIGRIWRFIMANLGSYLLAFLVWLIARFAAGVFGMILLCIGVIFTSFWSALVGSYAFAQVYRQSHVK